MLSKIITEGLDHISVVFDVIVKTAARLRVLAIVFILLGGSEQLDCHKISTRKRELSNPLLAMQDF